MRLAQLARKLSVSQNEIIKLLSQHGFDEKEHGNTKINDEEVHLVYAHFGTSESPENVEKAPEEQVDKTMEAEPEKVPEEPEEKPTGDTEETTQQNVDATSETEGQPVEVIRAKKVKLEGIKVVGKIELPEPRRKEEETATPGKHKRPKPGSTKKRRTLSYEEKVKREEEKLERERKKRIKKIKEKKKRHYFEKVQPKTAPKAPNKTRASKNTPPTQHEEPKRKKPEYKNPVRKLWAWLNGEYD